ncbi:penicillin acylase family protein [Gaetbulibacter aestuarii]|uniref:Penicillin acylase family protein n=1 Tax=Gaetbulibacter aestuarii TaxID=1502358 RepID=A0ABW7MVB1_9FLAO
MKYFKFILAFIIAFGIFYALNNPLGSAPVLGAFFNPNQGFWQNDKTTNVSGNLDLPGLKEPVTVFYDKHLIPHVFAQNDTDLYRSQGYITAQHRLWQMEFQTFASAGRLAEIVGEKAVPFDRMQRRKGLGYGAEKALERIKKDPEILGYLEAYRDGVNRYIQTLNPKDCPIEYKLLGYAPEPWTLEKTTLLFMYMTDDLCGYSNDFTYTHLLKKFGENRFNKMFPDFYDIIDPVIPVETDWSYIDTPITEIPQSQIPQDSIVETMEDPNPSNGSNNWAVSGTKSYSGHPILANDPHLGLNLPSIWYVMQLATPEHNSFGATLPGAMGVVSGFNTHIAWGETNATRDVKDWYKTTFKDASRTEYKYGDSWRKTKIRLENIKIKGKETYVDTVLYTHEGPVSYDYNYKGTQKTVGYAMKWTGHMGGNEQRTILELNEAKNYDDYVSALKHWVAPAQNFVFASTEGDIALWIQGLFANKWKGQGKFLMDGSNPDNEWQSFIPQEFNAKTKNPERGFVSSANQHPVDQQYPYYVFNDHFEAYRNRVINDFFRSKDHVTIQDFKDLQNNVFNLKASELLPYIFEHMDTSTLNPEETEFYNQIKDWDFNNTIDSHAATIWEVWWPNLFNITWDDVDWEDALKKKPDSKSKDYFKRTLHYQTIYLLKNDPDSAIMDLVNTPEKETSSDLFLISFKETVKQIKDWEAENGDDAWGKYKGTYVGHLLQALPAFSRFDIPVGGDRNTVNAADTNHGPSWRMIVEMTSPPTALGIYPGGQSGNPGSPYYDNFIDDWAAGNYLNLDFMQSATSDDETMSTQTLNPTP